MNNITKLTPNAITIVFKLKMIDATTIANADITPAMVLFIESTLKFCIPAKIPF